MRGSGIHRGHWRCSRRWVVMLAVAATAASTAPAHAGNPPTNPFESPEQTEAFRAELEFFKVESDVVTSVSRHPESLWGSAAAVYVVTGDDIRKAGAQALPDALRMVPGLDVASVDRNLSAISARGFNGFFADKMLVLLDGRPIYTPLFGGTVWPQWNTFLRDLDRIEVIRGPGGTLWGSNAVNGVINIITKSAEDTHGTVLETFGGSNLQFQSQARYGGRVGNFHYRAFGRYGSDEGFGGNRGEDIRDGKEESRGGYRFDWDLGRGLNIRSTGEVYDSKFGGDARDNNGLLLDPSKRTSTTLYTSVWRAEKDFANGSRAHVQLAGDYLRRSVPFLGTFKNIRRTWELELQYSFRPLRHHRLTWGANFRQTNVDVRDGIASFDLKKDLLNVVGGFVQDEISVGEHLRLILGTKVENNTFSGTNFQPSGRVTYRIDHNRTLWAAVSRAVNTPSYSDKFVNIFLPPDTSKIPGKTLIPAFVSDGRSRDTVLITTEAGYRHRFNDGLSLDMTAFYNDYDDIEGWSGNTTQTIALDPTTVLFKTFRDNKKQGHSYGAEAVLAFRVSDRWKGELNTSYQRLEVGGIRNPDAPQWKVNLRQFFDILPGFTLVPTLHWVDWVRSVSLFPGTPTPDPIASYLRFDLAIHFQPRQNGPTISVVGQNIGDRRHKEFSEQLVRAQSPVTRSWFVKVTQEF